MSDVFALGIPIRADDMPALAAFKNVERAGEQAAAKISISLAQASAALKTLGIEAKTASVNGIERIVVSAMQLDQTNAILARMAPGFKAVAVEATRAAAATQQVATASKTVATAATTTISTVTRTTEAGSVSYQKWGNAAIRASGAAMMMADAAQSGDKSLQNMLRTGSSIAFMFGPTGALVGAMGIAASFIVRAFEKAQESIRKAREETKKLIDRANELTASPGFASKGAVTETSVALGVTLADMRREVAAMEAADAIARRQFEHPEQTRLGEAIAKPADQRRLAFLREQIPLLHAAKLGIDRLSGAISVNEAHEKALADAIKADEEARKERQRIIEGEVGWLRQLNDLGEISALQVSRARTLELQYRDALKDTSLSIEQQINLLKKRNDAIAAQAVTFDMGRIGGDVRRGEDFTGAIGVKGASAIVDRNIAASLKSVEGSATRALASIGGSGAEAFASGFVDGLRNAFDVFKDDGIFAGIEALGRGLLASFGNILTQIGVQGLLANTLVQQLFTFLGTPAGFAASLGLIALGTALSALGGGGHGGGRGGAAGGAGGSIGRNTEDRISQRTFDPRTATTGEVTPRESNTYMVLGGGPQVERWIAKVATKADRRQLGKRNLIRVNG